MSRLDRRARPRGVGHLTQLAEAIGAATHLMAGDFEGAYAYASGLTAPGAFTPCSQQAVRTLLDLVESAVHTGRADQARAHALAARDQGLPAISPHLDFLTAAALAMTADDTGARAAFERAVAHPAGVEFPFELARVRLAQGMWLRRARERAAARTRLRRPSRRSSDSARSRGPGVPGPNCARPVRRSAGPRRAGPTRSPRRSGRSPSSPRAG
ncbi:hypothetical protein ACFZDJ_44045 [Streptomyces sp. NPDC007896]|uniref:hypothetical protein n=1 Tax=Streptomyces sp. NPDC007896 TaxID=3364784 RepID=UPI0036E08543